MGKLDRLSGVKVAITGGGRGIGRSTAAAFRAAGARVVIGDIDADLATRTAGEVGGLGLPLDVTDAASFQEFWGAAEQDGEPIRVLVNNAGIMPVGRFVDEGQSATDRQLAVNLGGVINGCRLAGRNLPLAGGGSIVNIASLAGATGFPGVATYSATKFAVVGLSAALRAEFEPLDVSVHVVLPGVVRTELSAGMRLPTALRGFVSVSPEDVADAVVATVRCGQFRRTVPRRLGLVLRAADLVPDGVRRRLERWTGYDDVLVGADPAVRAAYERRILGENAPLGDV